MIDEPSDDPNVIPFPAPAAGSPPPAEAAGNDELRAVTDEQIVPALEACLFAMPGVVGFGQLEAALGVSREKIDGAVEVLRERLVRTGSGLRLVEIAEGLQLRTDVRFVQWVAAIRGGKPFRLSRAALETLAIVAFRQPVSKGVVDDIRGVDCGGILRTLLDRGLVRMAGRSEEPGRPMTYGTTPAFLELFGMRSLADLPTLRDLRQLADDDPEASVTTIVPFPGADVVSPARQDQGLTSTETPATDPASDPGEDG